MWRRSHSGGRTATGGDGRPDSRLHRAGNFLQQSHGGPCKAGQNCPDIPVARIGIPCFPSLLHRRTFP